MMARDARACAWSVRLAGFGFGAADVSRNVLTGSGPYENPLQETWYGGTVFTVSAVQEALLRHWCCVSA